MTTLLTTLGEVHRAESDPACVRAARRAVSRAGWDAGRDLKVFASAEQAVAEGCGRYRYGGEVVLVVSAGFEGAFVEVVARERLRCLEPAAQALEAMIAADVYAQIGTFKVCPWGAGDYAEILQAVADGLQSAGANERQVRDYAVEVTGLFISSVVASVYGIRGPDPSSFRRGALIGKFIHSSISGTTMSRAVAIWSDVQMRLWGDDENLGRAVRSYQPPQMDITFEASRGIAILLDSYDCVDRQEDGLVWSDRRLARLAADELQFRYNAWPIKAFQLAELFFPYVAADKEDIAPPTPRDDSRRQAGSCGRPSEDATSRRQQLMRVPIDLGEMLNRDCGQVAGSVVPDPFALRLAQDGDFRQRILRALVGDGAGVPIATPSTEVLHALYQQRAARISMPSESSRGRDTRFPVAHLTRRPLGFLVPRLAEIDWGATRPLPSGRLQFYGKQLPVDEPIPVHTSQGGIPDLAYVVDSSGSMKWDWHHGQGPYDCLLRAVYSVERFLTETRKGPLLRYCAVNFSNTTLRTRWCGYAELGEVRRLLFRHQNGGTTLDCNVLRQVAAESRDHFLCLMVTDGQLKNAAEVATTAGDLVARGNWFVLIHIGAASALVGIIREAGLPAHTITAASQLEGLCLEYARRTWGVPQLLSTKNEKEPGT